MIYLLLTIICSSGISILFKWMGNYRVAILPAIILNYAVAFSIGILLFEGELSLQYLLDSKWLYLAFFVGSLLMAGLYLIGYTTQRSGIAVTTIANKMSVIIPISFSILYYSEAMNIYKKLGIVLALVAVLMAVYRKKDPLHRRGSATLPLLMFLLVGIIDSSMKLAQQDFVEPKDISLFTAFGFGLAGIIGVIIQSFNFRGFTQFANPYVLIFGVGIGIVNYGTMYFLLFALEKSGLSGSVVYGVNNIGIILLSIFIAFLFFKEKLSKINLIGIALAILAAILLTLLA